MNVRNVQKLIDELRNDDARDPIENRPLHFHMNEWLSEYNVRSPQKNECGTIGCAAGFSFLLAAEEGFTPALEALEEPRNSHGDVESSRVIDVATEWLELSGYEPEDLFYGEGSVVGLNEITREMTINVLEDFIKTGYIDWYNATLTDSEEE